MKNQSPLCLNIFFSFLQYFISGFYPLIVILFISTRLSVETWGELTLIQAISLLMSLLIIFGTDSMGMRKIPESGESKNKVFQCIKQIFFIRMINFLFIGSISLIFFVPYFGFVNTCAVLFWTFSIIISPLWAFIALDQTKKFISIETIIRILSLLALFSFIENDSDKYLHVLIISLSNLSFGFFTSIILLKQTFIKDNQTNNISLIKSGYKESFPFVSIQLLSQSYIMLPVILVGSILGSAEAANYGNAEKFQRLFRSLISPVGRVLLSHSSKIDSDNNKIAEKWALSAFFGIILFFIGYIMSTIFFDYFFSDEYKDMKQIAIIMFASLPFIFVSSHLINSFIYPIGEEIFLRRLLSFIATITIFLIIFFLNSSGIISAAIITLFAEIILAISIFIFMKKSLNN